MSIRSITYTKFIEYISKNVIFAHSSFFSSLGDQSVNADAQELTDYFTKSMEMMADAVAKGNKRVRVKKPAPVNNIMVFVIRNVCVAGSVDRKGKPLKVTVCGVCEKNDNIKQFDFSQFNEQHGWTKLEKHQDIVKAIDEYFTKVDGKIRGNLKKEDLPILEAMGLGHFTSLREHAIKFYRDDRDCKGKIKI